MERWHRPHRIFQNEKAHSLWNGIYGVLYLNYKDLTFDSPGLIKQLVCYVDLQFVTTTASPSWISLAVRFIEVRIAPIALMQQGQHMFLIWILVPVRVLCKWILSLPLPCILLRSRILLRPQLSCCLNPPKRMWHLLPREWFSRQTYGNDCRSCRWW